MVQGYYTLPEAAQFLGMSVDELKQMAQKGKIRSFQDRGTLRFRTQDIQELARKRGGTSDPDLPLGDAPPRSKAKPTGSSAAKKAPASSPKSPAKKADTPEVFSFDIDDDSVEIGHDLPLPTSAAKSSKPGSKSKKPAGTDSDVRLVADGSDVTFSVPRDSKVKPADSDVKISPDPLKPKTGFKQPPSSTSAKRPSQLAIGSGAQPKSKFGSSPGSKQPTSARPHTPPHTPADSGVRLVPMDSDSDVKLLGSSDDVPLGEGPDPGATDSNVRLEKVTLPAADSAEGPMNLTEEINLDEELRQQQEREKDAPLTKLKAKSELKLPTTSPFELSDSDLAVPSELKKTGPKTPKKAKPPVGESSDFDITVPPSSKKKDSSSDFDLTPAGGDSSSDFNVDSSDDHEQVLGQEQHTELTSATSGISINNPADQGISLEDNESSEFDLSLDVEDTPKPAKSSPAADSSEFELSAQKTPKPHKEVEDSDAEFDLSLEPDADSSADGDSSEFELSLDGSGEGAAGTTDSDSEFELTLDDSGNLAALDEAPPQVKAKKKKPAAGEEQDIFDTDFEVPSLDSTDDDATVADSELESSDFDLALDDSELAQEDESGSQVVALDEEDAATVTDEDAAVVDDVDVEEESSDFQDLDQDVEVDADDEVDVDVDEETARAGKTRTVVQEKLVPAAPWGVMPVVFMLPCVIIMFFVGLLGLELVQTSTGMKPPGVLTTMLAEQFGTKVTLK
jgi:excisionase family DNA binding protein